MSHLKRARRFVCLAAAATLALGAVAAPAGAESRRKSKPLVFAPQGKSKPRFPVAEDPQRVEIEAHDGIALHARVYRPNTSSDPRWKTPVILVHSPYYDSMFLGDDERSMDIVERYSSRGYTVVLSDVRGTGNSGGCNEQDGINQAKDFKTLVEYFAKKPWTNGKVGSYGKSYDAEAQNAGAVLQPKGLKTMVTVAGISGLYDVPYFDGVPYELTGAASAGLYAALSMDPPGDPTLWPRLIERPGCQPANLVNGADPRGDMNDYWKEREFRLKAKKVNASVLYAQGLNDPTVLPINIDGWYDRLPVFKRALLGQWAHHYSYETSWARDDWYRMVDAWFDHWLLGLDTKVKTWPKVQVQDERNIWRAVDSVAEMGLERPLPLGKNSLGTPGKKKQTVTFAEDEEATWTTNPLKAPLHLSGQVYLDALITLDRSDAHFAYRVEEVTKAGATELTHGYLSAPHRKSLSNPKPIEAGEPVRYRIRSLPFDTIVDKGAWLRLVLSGSDGQTLPAGTAYTAEVAVDGSSKLLLPVARVYCGLRVDQRSKPAAPIPGCRRR